MEETGYRTWDTEQVWNIIGDEGCGIQNMK